MPVPLGIDFGTTKCVAAVGLDERVEVVLINGQVMMPSIVITDGDGIIRAGWDVDRLSVSGNGKKHSTRSIKRLLGQGQSVLVGNQRAYPQEVAAVILRYLHCGLSRETGQTEFSTVIAVPAHFDVNQRQAVMDAAQIAGFQVKRMISEPTATALTYQRRYQPENCNIAIADMGGGTFDLSIVEFGAADEDCSVCEVLASSGDNKAGGDDLDEIIANWILRQFGFPPCAEMTDDDEPFVDGLLDLVSDVKKELSETSQVTIRLPRGKLDMPESITITRDEFEQQTSSIFKRVEAICNQAKSASGVEVDRVLLTGRMNHMPWLQQAISAAFGKPCRIADIDPITCVAEGAAIQASILAGQNSNLLLDSICRPILLPQLEGDPILVPSNTTIPTRDSRDLQFVDGKKGSAIRIEQGSLSDDQAATLLGNVALDELPFAESEGKHFQLLVDIDTDGLISIQVRHKASGKQVAAELHAPGRLRPAQIKALRTILDQRLSHLAVEYENVEHERVVREIGTRASAIAERIPVLVDRYRHAMLKADADGLANAIPVLAQPVEHLQTLEAVKHFLDNVEEEIKRQRQLVFDWHLNSLADSDWSPDTADYMLALIESIDGRPFIQRLLETAMSGIRQSNDFAQRIRTFQVLAPLDPRRIFRIVVEDLGEYRERRPVLTDDEAKLALGLLVDCEEQFKSSREQKIILAVCQGFESVGIRKFAYDLVLERDAERGCESLLQALSEVVASRRREIWEALTSSQAACEAWDVKSVHDIPAEWLDGKSVSWLRRRTWKSRLNALRLPEVLKKAILDSLRKNKTEV